MNTWMQDVKYGVRMLWKAKGFTAVALIALALGIGANVALFSVADAFLWKALPFPDSERLVVVLEHQPRRTSDWNSVSPANYLDWKAQSQSFDGMAGYASFDANLAGEPEPERVPGLEVSTDYFSVLGVQPALGRAFLPEEDTAGKGRVAVLSHELWIRRFGANPRVIGQTIRIEGEPHEVVGVLAEKQGFLKNVGVFRPLAMSEQARNNRASHYMRTVARLKTGVTKEQAYAEMETIAARLGNAYPDTNRGWGTRIFALREFAVGNLTRQYTLLLMGAVGFVLLIACANVAGMQFARAAARKKEIALRAALGARRWRTVRQLLTETVLVSLVASAFGLLLALWGVELILAHMPPDIARFIYGWEDIRLDARAFVYALGIAVLAGILSGLTPALMASKTNLSETLREGGRTSTGTRSQHRLRAAFVVGQMALAVVLLIGASLMAKGVKSLIAANDVLQPQQVLTLRINFPESQYKAEERRVQFLDAALDKMRGLPDIQSVAAGSNVPFGGNQSFGAIHIEGEPAREHERYADSILASPSYFRTMNIRLKQGREFTDQDAAGRLRVVIINERFARQFFPGQDPIGHRIRIGQMATDVVWWTIAGVVEDVQYEWTDGAINPTFYRPYAQRTPLSMYIALRTAGQPMAHLAAVRTRLGEVDASLPVYQVKSLDRVISDSVVGISYVAVILTILGVIALVLSCVGVFGMMAYAVSERTQEIGVRMALGAQRGQVLGMVLRRGMLLTLLGLALGLPGAYALAQVLAGLIFGVSAQDWSSFTLIPAALAAVALVACWVPARRAMKVEPVEALRYE